MALLDCVTGSGLRGFKKLTPFPVVPFPLSCSSHLAHLLPLSCLGQSSLIQEKNTQCPELVVDRSCHPTDIGMGRAEDSKH